MTAKSSPDVSGHTNFMDMKAGDIEIAVANHFDWRRNLIVPNLSWGLFRYEMDVLVVRKSGWGVEVEIKVSKADLKKDRKKRHCHNDRRVRELYFAVPKHLVTACTEYAPEHAGIISVEWVEQDRYNGFDVIGKYRFRKSKVVRMAQIQKHAIKFTQAEIEYIARLGCMRIWALKGKLLATNSPTKQHAKLDAVHQPMDRIDPTKEGD